MASLPELYSNFQINYESENKKKISHSLSNPTKDEFVSASVSTLETVSEYQKNQIHKLKKTITTKQRALTPGKFFSKKLAFFIKQEFSINKDKSAFNLITKKNKILGKNKNAQKSNETDKSSKNIDDKMQEIKKKFDYCQLYRESDFDDQPPSVPSLFLHDYNFKNKNCFSRVNSTLGKINESDKIPNVYYNHLMIHNNINSNNISYCSTSVSKRFKEKLLSIIYYSPKI